MRLFVAIELAPGVVAAALALIDRLRAKAVRLAPQSRMTWVTADRLHVTVRFIGHVDDQKANAITDALGSARSVAPFDLTLAGTGAFPPTGRPRVVWAGLTVGRDRLLAAERTVSERLALAGVAPENRRYNPHLTLARVRDAAGLRAASLLDGVSELVLGVTPVVAITLFDSRLSPKGPTYVALQRVELIGGL
jgi:2'-5' RNA ligase